MLGTGKNQFVESTSTDGFFFSFIEVDWKCINCPLQRTVLQSHLRFNEFSWCGALAKRQKKLPETGKKRKITWRIRKKRSKSVSIFTQKLFVNKMSSASYQPIWLWRSLKCEFWIFLLIFLFQLIGKKPLWPTMLNFSQFR